MYSVHIGPSRRQHQHTDCLYSHQTGLHENDNNKMALAHFIINGTILIFKRFKHRDLNSIKPT